MNLRLKTNQDTEEKLSLLQGWLHLSSKAAVMRIGMSLSLKDGANSQIVNGEAEKKYDLKYKDGADYMRLTIFGDYEPYDRLKECIEIKEGIPVFINTKYDIDSLFIKKYLLCTTIKYYFTNHTFDDNLCNAMSSQEFVSLFNCQYKSANRILDDNRSDNNKFLSSKIIDSISNTPDYDSKVFSNSNMWSLINVKSNEMLLTNIANKLLDTFNGNKYFIETGKQKYIEMYLSKKTVKEAKNAFSLFEISGILNAYRLFYVGCSRARKKLLLVILNSQVGESKDNLKRKLIQIGFSEADNIDE